MAHKRKKKFQLTSADQLRVLASPASIEIIQALRQKGPITVSELGPVLGRKSNSLHYHIRKLVKNGMVVKTGERRSGARMESIYDTVADAIVGTNLQHDKKLQKLTSAGVGAILRLAKRNWDRASDHPELISKEKETKTLRAQQMNARLTEDETRKINAYIEKISDVFEKNIGSEDGQMCSLTFVLTPVITDSNENSKKRK